MQQPSPTLSSPSTGFLGPRSSPLFSSAVDQPDQPPTPSQDVTRSSSMASGQDSDQAPPRRLATALEGLTRAIRHIANVRSGADLLLEALDSAALMRGRETGNKKASDGIQRAADTMKKALDELRATGKELEGSGVLNGAQQKYEENGLWNMQVPFVAPDGALVPYAWKRQIAGQAAASAYDRARVALKAFSEQKRRFFPGLEASTTTEYGNKSGTKRPRDEGSESSGITGSTLPDVLKRIQTETPGLAVTPYMRLAWANKSKGGIKPIPVGSTLSNNSSLSLRNGIAGTPQAAGGESSSPPVSQVEKTAVLEVSLPGVLMAVVSILPAGSIYPDAVAIFSPAETGGHVQAWGVSQHNLHQRLSEYAAMVLHQFLQQDRSSALELFLRWLYSYRTLFTQPCLVCKRMMAYDAPSDLFFPPLVRPAQWVLSATKISTSTKPDNSSMEGEVVAYHLGCTLKDKL